MKVTALVHAYVNHGHNAGAETTMHDLLRAMVEDGWEAEVILSREDPGVTEPYGIDGVKVTPYQDRRQIIPVAMKSDLLISHLENSERVAVVGQKYNVPTVQVVHNNMEITKNYATYPWNILVFNTDWVAEDFRASMGRQLNGKHLSVVHPRVDTSRYVLTPQKGSQGDYITLVNLWDGSLRGKNGKGAHTFYEMARRYPNKKFLGVLGGYGEQSIKDLPNVTILPHTSNMVEDVYSKTRILLMPSRYESFGRVAVEGAACGIPTIASPTPGLMEAMGAGWGFYAEPDDYETWYQHIMTLSDGRRWRSASSRAKDQADYWYRRQPYELEEFLEKARSVAFIGKQIRGY